MSESALLTLKSCSTMEFLQFAGPAIRDIGIYDINGWSEGFENLYKEIWDSMFDKDRNLHDFLVPALIELRQNSTVGADRYTLAGALARIGATYAFVKMSMDRQK